MEVAFENVRNHSSLKNPHSYVGKYECFHHKIKKYNYLRKKRGAISKDEILKVFLQK